MNAQDILARIPLEHRPAVAALASVSDDDVTAAVTAPAVDWRRLVAEVLTEIADDESTWTTDDLRDAASALRRRARHRIHGLASLASIATHGHDLRAFACALIRELAKDETGGWSARQLEAAADQLANHSGRLVSKAFERAAAAVASTGPDEPVAITVAAASGRPLTVHRPESLEQVLQLAQALGLLSGDFTFARLIERAADTKRELDEADGVAEQLRELAEMTDEAKRQLCSAIDIAPAGITILDAVQVAVARLRDLATGAPSPHFWANNGQTGDALLEVQTPTGEEILELAADLGLKAGRYKFKRLVNRVRAEMVLSAKMKRDADEQAEILANGFDFRTKPAIDAAVAVACTKYALVRGELDQVARRLCAGLDLGDPSKINTVVAAEMAVERHALAEDARAQLCADFGLGDPKAINVRDAARAAGARARYAALKLIGSFGLPDTVGLSDLADHAAARYEALRSEQASLAERAILNAASDTAVSAAFSTAHALLFGQPDPGGPFPVGADDAREATLQRLRWLLDAFGKVATVMGRTVELCARQDAVGAGRLPTRAPVPVASVWVKPDPDVSFYCAHMLVGALEVAGFRVVWDNSAAMVLEVAGDDWLASSVTHVRVGAIRWPLEEWLAAHCPAQEGSPA